MKLIDLDESTFAGSRQAYYLLHDAAVLGCILGQVILCVIMVPLAPFAFVALWVANRKYVKR